MDNKRIAAIIVILVLLVFTAAAFMGLSSHIPFIGKALMLLFALILVGGVILIFVYAARKGKK